jgi:subtilase family serine protease
MNVQIVNRGLETAEHFTVRFEIEGFGAHGKRTFKVESLDPGQSIWLSQTQAFRVWPGPSGEVYTLRVVVDPLNRIREIVESNNVYQCEIFLMSD